MSSVADSASNTTAATPAEAAHNRRGYRAAFEMAATVDYLFGSDATVGVMAERLLEAAGRGMWAAPEQATLDGVRQVLLETEGDLEG